MNEKFFEIKKEKQDRMINAALKMFGMQGYKHASTDDMVKEAGISKGLLFHYFQSKIGVYRFAFDYSLRYTVLEMSTQVNKSETDLFVLYKQMELARLKVMNGYPYMLKFLTGCLTETDPEALKVIENREHLLTDVTDEIYARMDGSILPEGVNKEQFCRMMDYAINGLIEEHFAKDDVRNEQLTEEIISYLDMMRTLVERK